MGKIFILNKLIVFIVINVVLTSVFSCRKMDGEVTIPTYLKIDSVYVNTYYPSEGSPSAKITDVWIYVDDKNMGVFELPALFPLLFEGKHKLEIRPGIKLNGISSTRVPYPFYQPIIYNDFEFFPDSVIDMGALKAEYFDNVDFIWKEDFENSVISIVESEVSDTSIERTNPANNPEAFLSEYSKYSGKIVLTNEHSMFLGYTFNEFVLPKNGAPIMLELNFKTNYLLLVGVLVNNPSEYKWEDLVFLKETDDWNKIYINISPVVLRNPNAASFKIYFTSALADGEDNAEIYLDNIKLLYRIQ